MSINTNSLNPVFQMPLSIENHDALKEIESTENALIAKARNILDPSLQDREIDKVKLAARTAKLRIMALKGMGTAPEQLVQLGRRSAQELENSFRSVLGASSLFFQNVEQPLQNRAVSVNLREFEPNSSSAPNLSNLVAKHMQLNKPTATPQFSALQTLKQIATLHTNAIKNELKQQELASLKSLRENQMLKTQILAQAAEIATIIPDTVFGIVVGGAKMACNSHPVAQKVCQATVLTVSETADKIKTWIPESVIVTAKEVRCAVKHGIAWYVKTDFEMDSLLGIPREKTLAHHQQMGIILAFGAGRLLPFKKPPLERKAWIKLFEEVGYKLDKSGGKGSHYKLIHPELNVLIIPAEISKGIGSQLKTHYEKALGYHQEKIAKPISYSSKTTLLPEYKTPEHRFDYSKKYALSRVNFIEAKEFDGVIKRDLWVVRYHGKESHYKWFMPMMEANKHATLEEVADAMAKLQKFGEVSHVTLAKIPAGERVRFLHGRAATQIDGTEIRPGGGVQYLFYDFDPRWIVQTRHLSE